MQFFTYIAILVAFATLASAATDVYKVTSAVQDYFLLSQRQLQHDLEISQLKIDSVKTRSADAIVFLQFEADNILQKIQSVSDSLAPLQALSPIRKYCVQKYEGQLISYAIVQRDLIACRTAAQTRVNVIVNSAQAAWSNANAYTNVNLPSNIATCSQTYPHPDNQTKLEACVLEKVDFFSKQTHTYLASVDKNLEASACTLNDLTRDSLICTFNTEQITLITIGKVLDLIDNCVEQTEILCPCANSPNNTKATQSIRDFILEGGQ